MAAPLTTARLRLLLAQPPVAGALLEPRALSRSLAATIPADWPPEFFDQGAADWVARIAQTADGRAGWSLWMILLNEPRELIGTVGFKGPPAADGRVDMGYGVVASHQRRGYASEAARALIEWAFRDPRTTRVAAETFRSLPASIRVMEKSGMTFEGEGTGFGGEEGVLCYSIKRPSRP